MTFCVSAKIQPGNSTNIGDVVKARPSEIAL